ncbi:HD domain-containing phosphohydrolase [Stieleria varia]|uniref:Cyclic di-GMP phosphodiesterase response regulator RpfG n=1 Tax=Stieleria varia TaxID=2528005 RepID=A0A5C5ZPR6_9BACT|nr:HD domain-containing phosphohydrolase [Stieleria varia]TWT89469.1 Cyclic di-GMP phosphodiesterase response regulator RpfG [Stieleria varia]
MRQHRILFVDDEINVLRSYARSLRGYDASWVLSFEDCPLKALGRIQNEPFDVVVSDVRMPGLTGMELLQAIKENPSTHDVPVIIVTGEADGTLKRQAIDRDAADLLNKPVHTDDLIARLKSVLRMKQFSDQLKESNERLEQRVRQRTAELYASRLDIIWRLGKASEFRDEETGDHVIRVGGYSRAIAKGLGMSESFCENIFLAAPLHDIGKIGIPDSVLLKPGRLTNDEWRVMRSHCNMGVAILTEPSKFTRVAGTEQVDETSSLGTESMAPSANSIIQLAAQIAATHHEKWDGSGYPNGLHGDAIPLAGRIVAVADVYDALRSHRPYKEPFSVQRSLEIIREGAGSHFDPAVVHAFLECFDEIEKIEQQFSDLMAPITMAEYATEEPGVPTVLH